MGECLLLIAYSRAARRSFLTQSRKDAKTQRVKGLRAAGPKTEDGSRRAGQDADRFWLTAYSLSPLGGVSAERAGEEGEGDEDEGGGGESREEPRSRADPGSRVVREQGVGCHGAAHGESRTQNDNGRVEERDRAEVDECRKKTHVEEDGFRVAERDQKSGQEAREE